MIIVIDRFCLCVLKGTSLLCSSDKKNSFFFNLYEFPPPPLFFLESKDDYCD